MEEIDIDCPYCGEVIGVLLDGSAGEQAYYEDCSVCCRPIYFILSIDESLNLQLAIKRDDE